MNYAERAAQKTVRTNAGNGVAIVDADGFVVATMRFKNPDEADAFADSVKRMAHFWREEGEAK